MKEVSKVSKLTKEELERMKELQRKDKEHTAEYADLIHRYNQYIK